MIVAELIAKLQEMPQDAEVHVWSGYVEDYVEADTCDLDGVVVRIRP
jgi:hypothetical protein